MPGGFSMPLIRPLDEYRTIRRLLEDAERLAREAGEAGPGAEHLLLAAVGLPDGTARRAFERVGIDPADLPSAIESQHADALRAVGIVAATLAEPAAPAPPARGLFRSAPSAQAVFRRAVELSRGPKPRRLLGAHVVIAVAEMEHGSAPRALARLGVERVQLAAAAREELARAAG
jgi:ATP-dependent Clp protease ATP-binding subunit ClpA